MRVHSSITSVFGEVVQQISVKIVMLIRLLARREGMNNIQNYANVILECPLGNKTKNTSQNILKVI